MDPYHNHDGLNSPKVGFYNLIPIQVFRDSSGNYAIPTLAITGDQVLEGTMYLVNDSNYLTETVVVGTTSTHKLQFRLYAFIAGDWRDLTDI